MTCSEDSCVIDKAICVQRLDGNHFCISVTVKSSPRVHFLYFWMGDHRPIIVDRSARMVSNK